MNAFLIDGVRTPIGNFGGTLSPIRTDDLAAHALRALLERHPDLDPAAIGDVLMGCANQAGEDNRNVARMALLLAGLPHTVPGETINRLCASGMAATIHAARALHMGDADLMVSGGVEHMTRGPWVISKVSKPFGRDAEMHDTSFGWRFINPKLDALYGTDGMGTTAENLVDLHGISREDQDRFAAGSQSKAAKAREAGHFKEEIIPVSIPRRKQDDLIFAEDEFIKPASTPTSCPSSDPLSERRRQSQPATAVASTMGPAPCFSPTRRAWSDTGSPLAEIVTSAVVGVEPRIMGIGPVEASRQALTKAGLTLEDMDHIELNEAFAAQSLACTRSLGLADDDPRINPQGGAIALGHPLGMTGARILLTAARQLKRNGGRHALVTLCIGVGQGYATILRNPDAA